MSRLILVRHGPTAASDARAFPADESLTPDGRRAAAGLRGVLPEATTALSSPALRCLETAAAARLVATVEAGLAECDFGNWAGRTLAEIHSRDPDGVSAWMTDPTARPHGGESLVELVNRVAGWLAAVPRDGTTVAITHGGFVRAAIAHARGEPPEAVWQISAEPLSTTEFAWTGDTWQIV